jgi:DNA-binding beta-propeller fold protein YncE
VNRAAAAVTAVVLSVVASYAAPPVYTISKEVPIGAPDKFDFVHFDPSMKRVYVSHGTEVTVVDGVSGALVGRIPGFDTSHGIVTVPDLGKGFADSGNTKTVIIFDLKTLKPLATVAAGEDSDAMVYDAKTKRVFVMDADGAAFTAIDAVADKTLSTQPLGGKPESAVSDGAGMIYINIASTNELVRLNATTLAVEQRWPVTGCTSPHGLAMDSKTRRLFISCKNDVMKVVAADTGKIVASLPIGHGTDADAFDPVHNLAYSSNGDGTLSVIAEQDADTFKLLGNVPTRQGARTMAVDPASGRVFVVAGDAPTGATPLGGHGIQPGSLKLLFLDPK